MRYIADLHIHSPFSRATSKASHLPGLAAWAAVKGIQVVGTGDFTHSGWLGQIEENLEEAEPGFFRLKNDDPSAYGDLLPEGLSVDVSRIRFVLTSEISSIYKRGGRVRKVHNILFAPDLVSVKRINATLAGIGNLESDGRPILGLDSRDLLEILLEKAPEGFLVPAHIWTPWFSLFGSKSGFDAIEDCFGDLTSHIFALETGLSSDPDMNRMISALDRFSLISNSDCHSPSKLGREANVLNTGFDFFSMRDALRNPSDSQGNQRFEATVEFYPEEGKYHCDGHRKCKVVLEPAETRKLNGICPVCNRPLTVGVLYRVMELADRDSPVYPPGSPEVHSLVPLPELLSELLGVGPATKKVTAAYVDLIRQLGSEFTILMETGIDVLAESASPILAEAVRRVREGKVIRNAGYDGEFGVIRVFTDRERKSFGGQLNLFGASTSVAVPKKMKRCRSAAARVPTPRGEESVQELNPEQEKLVASRARHIIVKAGPGTGKTHSLVRRAVRLMREDTNPCTVITFTNRAADELQQRITATLDDTARVSVSTLHGYCLQWLRNREPFLRVAGPEIRQRLLRTLYPEKKAADRKDLDREITRFLQSDPDLQAIPAPLRPYFDRLDKDHQVDIDAIVPRFRQLLQEDENGAGEICQATGRLFVDEFQDLNRSQYGLIRHLAAVLPVFVIGDPDQAIYGFRGSSPEWFYRFVRDLEPEQHQLYRNYRNASTIVAAAGAVIAHNRHDAFPVKNESVSGDTGRIIAASFRSPQEEAGFVMQQVEMLLGGTSHREIDRLAGGFIGSIALRDIGVLYRTGRQAEILADILTAHGFPLQVVDVVPYYLKEPVRVLYLWTLVAAGLGDGAYLPDILQAEQGIGASRLAEIEDILSRPTRDHMAELIRARDRFPVAVRTVLEDLAARREELWEKARGEGIAAALQPLLAKYSIDPGAEDVIRFLKLADSFGQSWGRFGEHLQRYGDTGVYDPRAEALTLMTLHASKGLEFGAVFIVGLEEGMLPLAPRKPQDEAAELEHIEEERRLFYVGMTRSRHVLYLTRTEERTVHGRTVTQKPSRFLGEIPAGISTSADASGNRKKRPKRRVQQLSLFK